MSAVDPQQEVSDLKRKLRLIKSKLLDPTERNLRHAINMIDDTFATEELQINCSRFGITCTPPPMFAVPVTPPVLIPESPIDPNSIVSGKPTMNDMEVQTISPKMRAAATQTAESGDCRDFSQSELYQTTQTNIDRAIELLTETKSSLSDQGGLKRKGERSTGRSKAVVPVSTALRSVSSFPLTPVNRSGVAHMQRVQQLSETKPAAARALKTSEKLAIEDGSNYTPVRDRNVDPVSAAKRQRINDIEFDCMHCCNHYETETDFFYHECNPLPTMTPPFSCCGTGYKHRGYYTRHRDNKHKKPSYKQ